MLSYDNSASVSSIHKGITIVHALKLSSPASMRAACRHLSKGVTILLSSGGGKRKKVRRALLANRSIWYVHA